MSKGIRRYLLGSLILFLITTIGIKIATNVYGENTVVPFCISLPIMLIFVNTVVSMVIFTHFAIKDIFNG